MRHTGLMAVSGAGPKCTSSAGTLSVSAVVKTLLFKRISGTVAPLKRLNSSAVA